MPVDKQKQYERQAKWNQANTWIFNIRLMRTTEADLIEWLNTQENKAGYVKSLIRADMEKHKSE